MTDADIPSRRRAPAPGPTRAAATLPLPHDEAFAVARACIQELGLPTSGLQVLASARVPVSGATAGVPGVGPSAQGAAVLAAMTGGVVVSCRDGFGNVVVAPEGTFAGRRVLTALPAPDAATPVKQLLGAGTGEGASNSLGGSSFVCGTWFVVGPDVASIRTRVTTGRVTGPWEVSTPTDGFLYRRVAIPDIPAGHGYVADTEVLTRDGEAIDVAGVTGSTTTLG